MNKICTPIFFAYGLLNLILIDATNMSKQPVRIDLMPETRQDTLNDSIIDDVNKNIENATTEIQKPKTNATFAKKLYMTIAAPLNNLLTAPKVYNVMRNIATCVVNGAVELISYYFPAPLIPIIASVAGMMVPFEPVLMLRDKVPVTSYRRAFMTALNSFLGTFDKYRIHDYNDDFDPYMKRRFNRRMMNFGGYDKNALSPLEEPSSPGPEAASERGNKGNIIYGINKLFKTLNKLRHAESNENDPGPEWKNRN